MEEAEIQGAVGESGGSCRSSSSCCLIAGIERRAVNLRLGLGSVLVMGATTRDKTSATSMSDSLGSLVSAGSLTMTL